MIWDCGSRISSREGQHPSPCHRTASRARPWTHNQDLPQEEKPSSSLLLNKEDGNVGILLYRTDLLPRGPTWPLLPVCLSPNPLNVK